MKLLHNSK